MLLGSPLLQLLLQFLPSPAHASAPEQRHCCLRLAHIPTRPLPAQSCPDDVRFLLLVSTLYTPPFQARLTMQPGCRKLRCLARWA